MMTTATTTAASFTIGQLAREFDITARTLRFYEDKGLIAPRRRGRQRIYSRRDRARLKLILQGKRVGFALSEIKEMLDLYDLRDGQETQMRVSLQRFRERIAGLERQRHEIDQAIDDLNRTCTVIEDLLKERTGV
ncbi:MAG: transcriptional regulator [Hyphomicrobiales bacterium]|nr:MAG: transcriptional regulator [Hyphomicrobiales bacterium]